jgi:lipopolysaccharide transport system permease protein
MKSNNLEVRVYSAEKSHNGLGSLIWEMFKDLWGARDFGYRIARRDIQGQYRQSLLGIIWAFITPLMTALVWIFLNGSGVVKIETTGLPYPAYVFSGTMIWAIFSESIMAPISQTMQSKGVMTKINIQKEGLLIAAFYKTVFNAAIKLALLVILFLVMGVFPDWRIVFIPLIVMSIIFFGMIIGLCLTPIAMLYGDVSRAIPMTLQLLMFLSPVVYQIPSEGILHKAMNLNPVTPMIMTVRNYMSGSDFYLPLNFTVVMVISLALCLAAWVIYRISMPIILER